MTQEYLKRSTDFIMEQFRNCCPEEIVMLQTLESVYRNNKELSDKFFCLNLNLLLYNGYLELKSKIAIVLTERGYAYLQGKEPLPLNIDIFQLIPKRKEPKTYFYILWDIIGTDDDKTNPFYIKGSDFYNTIKEFLQGFPPKVSQYLSDIKDEDKRNKSRSEWYLDLFLRLEKSQIEPFLNKLSALINERNQVSIQKDNSDDDLNDFEDLFATENIQEITNNNLIMEESEKQKTPKVFISHNTEDREYARALTDLLMSLGVGAGNIFCSSYPPFAIQFGNNILDTIRKQFEEHDLFVLFIHSPRYYRSAISLNEMGAAWILKSAHLSFLTSDCSFKMLTGVIDSKEIAFKAGEADAEHLLFDFRDKIIDFFGLEKMDEKLWDTKKKEFIGKVNSIHYEQNESND